MWSSTSIEPYAQPSREPMSRCGARVIDSMPAATTTVASPTAIMRAPSMIAVSPDRHTLLTDAEWHSPRDAGAHRRLARGVLARAGGEHLPDEHGVDGIGRDAALRERAADRDAAELHRGERRELALESPLRSARGSDDDDVVVVHASTLSSTEPTCSGTISAARWRRRPRRP